MVQVVVVLLLVIVVATVVEVVVAIIVVEAVTVYLNTEAYKNNIRGNNRPKLSSRYQ